MHEPFAELLSFNARFVATLAFEALLLGCVLATVVKTRRRRVLVALLALVLLGVELALFDYLVGWGSPRVESSAAILGEGSSGESGVAWFEVSSPWFRFRRARIVVFYDEASSCLVSGNEDRGFAIRLQDGGGQAPVRLSGCDKIFVFSLRSSRVVESQAPIFDTLWQRRSQASGFRALLEQPDVRERLDGPLLRYLGPPRAK